MPELAREGDLVGHGFGAGPIIEGSPDVWCNGRRVAREGDEAICPIHGPNPIASGSSSVFANGRRVARIGDHLACGATILSGSGDTRAGG